ncbi:DUF5694 domain-containing protein [Pontibacillus sp. HMF3514]|uniref:DUF5694 domain-containing protein n=1 Tax=Pontibacillus sp. HMF3514 TaxID=2692425 RepID=UPI00131FE15A|nr:DUF5694 domain-containing protein [Pontibacillus sp. HMF3514]QHE52766.1 hypothetical protein GS400_12330 [Pontibacillus sp. HMF3514]
MTDTKPSVLVFGTYHMGDRGNRDLYQLNSNNINSDKKQSEIREVIECIKAYKPTKIAVEFETVRADILEDQYQKYISKELEEDLETDEIHQFGFRIAEELGHKEIYPVDWNRPAGGVPMGFVYEFLKETNEDLYKELIEDGEENNKHQQELINTKSIREVLVAMNHPEKLKKQQETYLKLALASVNDYYLGIEWLANYWHRRNLIIFNNVKQLVNNSDERILVIYGVGHKYLLDHFFEGSGQFHVHSIHDYL